MLSGRSSWALVLAPLLLAPQGPRPEGAAAGQAGLALFGAPPPLGLPALPLPEDDAPTAERHELGRRLFFDPVLSLDRSLSCASCHRPEHGFADALPVSIGVNGAPGSFNAPSLHNRGYGRHFMWDGRFGALEEQVLEPIGNPLELALGVPAALERLAADPEYTAAFERAFDDGLSETNLARALAGFVRGLTLGDTRVDRFRELGHHGALTAAERTGLWIYESKGGCWRCHWGPNFTDESFHNTGVGLVAAADGVATAAPGRFAATGDEADRGRFKTPSLRGVARTPPYMHDGSLATLEQVVAFYRAGGGPNPGRAPELAPLELTDDEAAALVAFLRALSEPAPEESSSHGGSRNQ
jgi:cytochrome c peroxidase